MLYLIQDNIHPLCCLLNHKTSDLHPSTDHLYPLKEVTKVQQVDANVYRNVLKSLKNVVHPYKFLIKNFQLCIIRSSGYAMHCQSIMQH
jgi:hypothetical protein